MIETVVALCMFYQGGIIEHTYKDTMSDCLKCYHNSGASLPMFRK